MNKEESFQGMKQKLLSELQILPIISEDDKYELLAKLFEQVGYGTIEGLRKHLSTFKKQSLGELEKKFLYLEVQFFLFFLADLMAFSHKQSDPGRRYLRYEVFLTHVIQDFYSNKLNIEEILNSRLNEYMAKFCKPGPYSNQHLSFLNNIYLLSENGEINTTVKQAVYDAFNEMEDFLVLMELESTIFNIFNECMSRLFKESQDISILNALELQSILEEGIQQATLIDLTGN